jgi:hypothetical protein
VLPGISTEQLRSRLNRMVADGMLTRQRYREVPPRVDYELTPRARELMPVLAELARWGYEWAWSSPRGSETIDLGAIFRLAPGLIQPSGAANGRARVTGDDGENAPAYADATKGRDDRKHGAERPRPHQRQVRWIGAFSRPRPWRSVSHRGCRARAPRADGMCASNGAGRSAPYPELPRGSAKAASR